MQPEIYREYLEAVGVPTIEQIVTWSDALFPGGFRLLQDDLCFPEDEEDWTEGDRQEAYIAIGEAVLRERSGILEDREQLKREVVQAAIIHYQLQQEEGYVYPVVQLLEVEQAEQADFVCKFGILVAGRAAIVSRDWSGVYQVEDDPERHLWENEEEEREAYQVLLTAAHYLEVDVARLESVEVQDLSVEGTRISASWLLKLNSEICRVDCYDEESGPRYEAREWLGD